MSDAVFDLLSNGLRMLDFIYTGMDKATDSIYTSWCKKCISMYKIKRVNTLQCTGISLCGLWGKLLFSASFPTRVFSEED